MPSQQYEFLKIFLLLRNRDESELKHKHHKVKLNTNFIRPKVTDVTNNLTIRGILWTIFFH